LSESNILGRRKFYHDGRIWPVDTSSDYRVDENDLVTRASLIVSTTHNNQAMNEAIRAVARQHLDGHELTEGLLNHIEVAVRAFDPCLSCATHALGKMPLEIELVDAGGTVVDRLAKDGPPAP
jgi:NAD-reducing hydrogenase large subunit